MAPTRTERTAAGTPAQARPANTDETAQKGAEGIQDDEQPHEKGQRMSRPDGPDEAKDQRAQAPKDGAGAAGAGKTAEDAPKEPPGAEQPAEETEKKPVAPAGAASKPEAPKGAAPKGTAPAGATRAADRGADTSADGTGPAGADAPQPGAPATGADADAASASGDGPGPLVDKEPEARTPSGVAQGAGAVVSAGLGVVSLTGGWLGTVAGARESLVGQLSTAQGASVAQQIQQVYGDQWHAIALVGGMFALLALLVGVVVLARPAFGEPGAPQAPWIKSVSWAGVVLGVIGLLLAVLKYSDAILGLPSVHS